MKLLVSRSDDRSYNQAGCDGCHDVIAIYLTPFITTARRIEAIRPVVEPATTVPIIPVHATTLSPIIVPDEVRRRGVGVMPWCVMMIISMLRVVPIVLLLCPSTSATTKNGN